MTTHTDDFNEVVETTPDGSVPTVQVDRPASHTPGPWVEIETESSVDYPDIAGWQDIGPEDGKPVAIALGYDRDWTDSEVDANARLIAAAPDLLRELQAMVTGTTYSAPPTEINGVLGYEVRLPVEFVEHARAAISKATGASQ